MFRGLPYERRHRFRARFRNVYTCEHSGGSLTPGTGSQHARVQSKIRQYCLLNSSVRAKEALLQFVEQGEGLGLLLHPNLFIRERLKSELFDHTLPLSLGEPSECRIFFKGRDSFGDLLKRRRVTRALRRIGDDIGLKPRVLTLQPDKQ